MIYPTSTGKPGEYFRLHTLESVWIQGKLRMWGRWSYIGSGKPGNMFNQLLASRKLTKTAINEALRRLKKSGTSKPELEAFLREILDSKNKSGLAFCTDEEGLKIDGVIGTTLVREGHSGLYGIIVNRYRLRKSKRLMAEELQAKHPEWCYMTCRRRIDSWLSFAESMLYAPMCDTFGTNSDRLYLKSEPIND
ncbi:DUF1133 family protein [Salmonella enterica subsp. enterica]|uniref:DUF1133 family protein n=1 Tax=Salmonella enterica subsp. enterica serovar Pomona TaxID=570935 RepID=A0A5X0GNP8_SALET|nr:DUF1133 family protein [Salmonella enterica subsp. enterica]EAN8367397.1 DUF1133 family protein [Salmonella enterica]EBG5081141.1 DUF1133 family protein [Salmonella enterica subsp. enterica serovar Adelaide]EBS3703553.1 hypothetical protein [Salmonella enterica subsp. enterica serovar Putten]EBX3952015.1 hypothetical protein [Salmonella enterica subsp. enterica serovar Offa]EBY7362611.1 DUF1133 family protein [Salmonella enterica subsp. enterica serovar Tennessee]EBY7405614.1 DUF1133 famil